MKKKAERKYPRYFYLIGILLPLFFLFVLEVVLRISGYGKDYSTFRKLDKDFQEFLFFNPDLPNKYFPPNQVVPSVIPDAFLESKPDNGFRIFVIGESSVAGFPYPPNASFPRFLKRKLEMLHPEKFVEVINLGVSAINSNTIADITDDIIIQKPDLILIYTGHNEYYGVTGVASNPLLANSRFVRKIFFSLKKIRMYQLFENIFYKLIGLLSDQQASGKTLMATMVNDKLIEYNSDEFKAGLAQFESNMTEVLEKLKKNKIPVIMSTIISNDEISPLENVVREKEANEYFHKAETLLRKAQDDSARVYFDKAKQFDALRFRAPNEINKIVCDFAKNKYCELLDVEKIFRSNRKGEILTADIFVDHLHLNIESNKNLADLFIEKIYESGILPKSERIIRAEENIDKLLNENLPLTRIDSSFSAYSIKILMNSFPFSKNEIAEKIIYEISPENFADSLALQIIRRKLSWDNAHIIAANKYFKMGRYFDLYREMNVLIEDKPFEKANYYNSVNLLESVGQDYLAYPILKKLDHRFTDKFSSKKLGMLLFRNHNYKESIKYLSNASTFSPQDPELFFTLSAAYYFMKDSTNALSNIKKCIELKPNYPNAENIYKMLTHKTE